MIISASAPEEAKFWSKADKGSPSECWNWLASKNTSGYGAYRFRGRMVNAHRAAYILSKGEVPGDLCVLHTCDNPICVNPEHLFLGSRRDNADDALSKGRAVDFAYLRQHGIVRHTRPHPSEIKKLDLEQKYPEVYGAIHELESTGKPLVSSRLHGLLLPSALYLGIKRRGSGYTALYLSENHIEISHKAMIVLNAVSFFGEFTTYDMLLEYLKTHNWGKLEPDRGQSPPAKQKPIDERDVKWLMESRKWTREQALDHLNGLERLG